MGLGMSTTAEDWEREALRWASEVEHASQDHRLMFETLAREYGRLAREWWPIPGEITPVCEDDAQAIIAALGDGGSAS
jgi:hypothetical protein